MRAEDLRGKRILITHTIVQNIMGSTMVALDMARYFRANDVFVDLFCGAASEPMSIQFKQIGVNLIADEDFEFDVMDYSLVWVNSQVVPMSIVSQISSMEESDLHALPPFIFYHMSSLSECPDEMPYIFSLEERLSSLSLFVSDEAMNKQKGYFKNFPQMGVFENCAPEEFLAIETRVLPQEPERILVVSNHAPDEVVVAIGYLRDAGKEVLHLGEGGDAEEVLSAKLLSSFDAVITIGKTVQFCLVAGIPVYVYDHFGGFGYLSEDNYRKAEVRNFSGRGGMKKDAKTIVDELIGGYGPAKQYQTENTEFYRACFSMAKNLRAVISRIEPREIKPFSSQFSLALESAQRFGFRYYKTWSYTNYLKWKDWVSWKELEARLDRIGQLEEENRNLDEEIRKLTESSDYRLGRSILRPVRWLQRKLK